MNTFKAAADIKNINGNWQRYWFGWYIQEPTEESPSIRTFIEYNDKICMDSKHCVLKTLLRSSNHQRRFESEMLLRAQAERIVLLIIVMIGISLLYAAIQLKIFLSKGLHSIFKKKETSTFITPMAEIVKDFREQVKQHLDTQEFDYREITTKLALGCIYIASTTYLLKILENNKLNKQRIDSLNMERNRLLQNEFDQSREITEKLWAKVILSIVLGLLKEEKKASDDTQNINYDNNFNKDSS